MSILKSKLFTESDTATLTKLENCAIGRPNEVQSHFTIGEIGEHVRKIQSALNQLSKGPGRENFNLEEDGRYGSLTAAAVKRYKSAPQRRILGIGQATSDSIVGKQTIKSLDDEMDFLENELPAGSKFVSLSVLGAPHDHSKCPRSGFSRPGSDGRVHHVATPINPVGSGRKINIGGEDETKYLSFEDFSTRDGVTGGPPVGSPPDRPFTEALPSRCASDICLRDSPLTAEIRKEISRLARPGCRLTVAQNDVAQINENRGFLQSLGGVVEDVFIFSENENEAFDHEVVVITMRGDGRYFDEIQPSKNTQVFPPGRVVRQGQNAQVLP